MSLINKLFSHHRQTETATSAQSSWLGESGKAYPYEVYPLDVAFQNLPGNFIYAKQADDGSWVPIYIAQTRNLHQRLEGHVSVDDAVQNGATHMHAHYDTVGQAARCTEERDLIQHWHPVLND